MIATKKSVSMGTAKVRDKLAKDIYITSHLVETFVLRSGQFSGEYFDKYLFESKPELLRRITTEMAKLVPDDTEIL